MFKHVQTFVFMEGALKSQDGYTFETEDQKSLCDLAMLYVPKIPSRVVLKNAPLVTFLAGYRCWLSHGITSGARGREQPARN